MRTSLIAAVCLILPSLPGAPPTATTTALVATPNPSTFGQQVTLTATVTPASATGNVTFYDGATVLGVSAVSAGQAVFKTTLLPAGTNPLTARYDGDVADSPSLSVALTQTVNAVAGGTFLPPVNSSAGSAPGFTAAGDFNRDGKADLVTINVADLSVLIGNGDGSFKMPVNYAAGSQPGSAALGDFNADGKMDLAISNFGSANVSVLLGNGDGTFQAAVNYLAGLKPTFVAAGDFNGDGKVDLVVANQGGGVSVLQGNGDGSFQAPMSYGAGNLPISITVGDFNKDGKADLAVANYLGGNVSILMGNGDGTFKAAVNYATGLGPNSIVVGDFNADGLPDLAVTNFGNNAGNDSVSVLLGAGAGSFFIAVNYPAGGNPSSVATGDFNGDGKIDLAIADYGATSASILIGNGNGTFQSALHPDAYSSQAFGVVADFNGDGRADLAVSHYFNNLVTVLLGVPAIPDLTISKTHSDTFTRQQTGVTYTLTVTNVGGVPTSGMVSLIDTAPAGLTVTGITGVTGAGWSCTQPSGPCTRSDALAPSSSYPTLKVTVNVAANAPDTVTNMATVSGGGEVNTANDTASDPTAVRAITPTPPTSDSVQPISSSGPTKTFEFQYSSVNGYSYLNAVYALINSSLSIPDGCVAVYVQSINSLYLANDAGSGLIGPLTPGSAGTLSNSQCTINGTGIFVSGSGNTLTLDLTVSSKPVFKGLKTIYGYAGDNGGMVSGWPKLGTYTPNTISGLPPTTNSVTPNNGVGFGQTFVYNYSSPDGYAYINYTYSMINSSLSLPNGCLTLYVQSTNSLYLYNDAGNSISAPLTPGSAGSLSNSQCTISGPGSSVSGSGNTLTVSLATSFQTSFLGPKTIYGAATDDGFLTSGWRNLGSYMVSLFF